MTKISDLSDGGTLQSTDELIVVRSGGNARAKMNTLPDMTVSQSPSVPSSSAQIFYNSTKGAVLRGQGSTSDVRLENDLGQAALTVKTGTKLVGVATASPTRTLDVNGTLGVTHSENNGVKVTANDTVGNSSFAAATLDYNLSGSDSLSGDRNHIGLNIDVDSSASGGDTSNEHRLFGAQVSVKATADSDIIYGLYSNAEAEISTGQVSSLYGVYGRAESDGVGGQVSNSYGVLGAAVVNNDAGVTQTSAHGVFGKCTVGSSNAADVNNLMGAYFEIQLDNPAVDNVPVNYMYGNRIEIDLNDNSSGGSYDLSGTTSYLLYANYSVISGGVMPGNAYGLYINDTVENYFRGSLRVDNGAVFNEQSLAASDFRVETNAQTHGFFVDSSLNCVGINNSAPGYNLDVNSTIHIGQDGSSGYTHSRLIFESNGNGRGIGSFYFNQATDLEWFAGNPYNDTDSFTITRQSTTSHAESTSNYTLGLFTIDGPTGNVGIGLGSGAPTTRLYVYENLDNAYVARFTQDHETGWGVLIDTDGTANGDPALWIKNAANTTALWASQAGQCGIGTTAPSVPLHVVGPADTNVCIINGTGTQPNYIFSVRDDNAQIFNVIATQTVVNETSKDYDFRVESDANNHAFFVQGSSGGVCFGKSTTGVGTEGGSITGASQTMTKSTGNTYHFYDGSAYKFYVNVDGGIRNYSSNNSNLSDEREKKNIEDLESQWDSVKQFDLKKFHFNADDNSATKKMGVIAQDVLATNPSLVTEFQNTESETRYAVREQQMMWMAIKALQESQARIENLESRIATL